MTKKPLFDERKLIITLLFFVISYPLIRPIGIPLEITDSVRTAYKFIEDLPEGSAVIMSFDCTPSGFTEVGAAANAMMKHLFSRNIRVIGISFLDTGPAVFERAAEINAQRMNKEYGVDYVNLGFRAGGEASMAAFALDFHQSVPVDYRGNSVSTLPIMQDVKSVHDIELLISVFSSNPGIEEWIRQVGDPHKVPIVCASAAGSATRFVTYVQAKQMVALLSGLRGGAEYELISQQVGTGVAGMDAQSVVHMFIVCLIIVGNIAYFRSKREAKGGKPL